MRAASGVGRGWGNAACARSDCHSRLRGNGLYQPLDSGLRRNDGESDKHILAIFYGIPFILPFGLPRARITGLFMRCRSFRLSAAFLNPAPSSFRRRPESRKTEPGCWRCTGSVCLRQIGKDRVLGCHPRWRGNGLYQPLDSGLRRNDGESDKHILAIFYGIPFILPFGLPRARITGLFMRCRSFRLSAAFLNPAPSSFRRRPESRKTEPGCWRCTGSVCLRQIGKDRVLGCHPRWRGNGLYQPLDSGLRRNDGEVL